LDSIPLSDTASPNLAALPKESAAGETRVVTIVGGRGRVGKTVVANTIVQFCRERGADLRVWNADRQNETHSLSVFHSDATRPETDDAEDKRLWLEARFDEQARERYDAVLDMAGGDPLVRQLAREARLVSTLEKRSIRSVLWQVLGPDLADLDQLKLSMAGGLFMPATLLVLNSGLVRSGRSVVGAFDEVVGHEVFRYAVAQGAQVVWFPELICMQAVSDRGLTFGEAKGGVAKPGQEPMSFFDQARVEIFWENRVPAFFSEIPRQWLPAMPAGLGAADQMRG
jgi:hypothetical protein